MEFFGFSSSTNNMDSSFCTFPETILKNYNPDLTQKLNVPAEAEVQVIQFPTFSQLFHLSYVKLLGAEVGSMLQGIFSELVKISEKPLVRHVVAGLVAAIVLYGAWKMNKSWNEDIHIELCSMSEINADLLSRGSPNIKKQQPVQAKKHKARSNLHVANVRKPSLDKRESMGDISMPDYLPSETEHKSRSSTVVAATNTDSRFTDVDSTLSVDNIISSTEQFQRQLSEALSKLDEVRVKLVEIENEKNLLAAEINLRKRVVQRLQHENTFERDKRQQAELKMEMMEIENNQLRQLRKELLLKATQVERLEKFLREKEEQQEKFFEENIILPRTVAQIRAKEFGELQHRIQKLESELSLTASNTNARHQIPPCDGPTLNGVNKNFCSHATMSLCNSSCGPSSNDKLSISLEKQSVDDKTLSESSSVFVQSPERKQRNVSKETNSANNSKTHGGKGVMAQLKAFITGTTESSSESDIEDFDRDDDMNQLSDGQSSVFMSASCGSESSENDVTIMSSKTLDKKPDIKVNPSKKFTKFRHRKTCEKDINVSKCLQDVRCDESKSSDAVTYNENFFSSSRIDSQLDQTRSPSCSSITSNNEAKANQISANTGSSDDRGTESEESWIVIMPTVG